MKIIKGVKPRRFKQFKPWYKKITVDDITIVSTNDRYGASGWFSSKYEYTEVYYQIKGRGTYYFRENSTHDLYMYPKQVCLNHFHNLLKEHSLI